MSELEVDLRAASGPGPVPCPKCGVTLDPDDTTESVYVVLSSPYEDEVLLKCKKCGSKVKLTGLGESKP